MGECDGLLYALIAFVAIDYITGVMCAINDKTFSSEVGFKGICRKVLIFLLVGIANILDLNVIGTGSVLRTAVIFFYISNEGVSLLKNASHLGLPVPQKIKAVLEQLHDRAEDDESRGRVILPHFYAETEDFIMSEKTTNFINTIGVFARNEFLSRDRWVLPSV